MTWRWGRALVAQIRPTLALPQFSGGSLALLKWLGLVLMVGDHVDAFVFSRALGWPSDLGRLVFPIFAVVIGYNLARPSVDASARARIAHRLVVFGLLAFPAHWILTQGGRLNVFATFAVAVLLVDLLDKGRAWEAFCVFVLLGGFVEYAWPGVALVVGVWALYRDPSAERLGVVAAAASALWFINGSMLALWALPLVLLASRLSPELPRLRFAFYGFYPLHLAAFVVFGWFR